MRVLLTGATGFLGRHLAARLLAEGHELVCAVRDPARAVRMFPGCGAVGCEFRHDVTPETWAPRLAGIDALINCAGILQASDAVTNAVHTAAPIALFDACVAAGVRKVVQISALGADPGAGTAYADSKHAADLHLAKLDLDWTVVKPSLVYTPAGSYGGTSLFRAIAALPLAIPVVGDGNQRFQPIHMDDFAAGIVRLLDTPARAEIVASGPEPLTIAEILKGFRAWLGLAPAAMDVALGLPLLFGWRVRLFCGLQVAATLGYLAWLSIAAPLLWLAPLGPLVKTVPVAIASLILMAIEHDK
ncbi:MAG: SDR family oxidoreductase [Alphaproteobacteria bacterium]|jgi:uncharacterized protein YbjT (DUF2867 family)|nr:SDR family oxidoreductase [Alphaproteobacteria bacterium]